MFAVIKFNGLPAMRTAEFNVFRHWEAFAAMPMTDNPQDFTLTIQTDTQLPPTINHLDGLVKIEYVPA